MSHDLREASRLVSYGNAYLSRNYDLGRATGTAIAPSIRRWKFEILTARRRGFPPLETVARSPQGWFGWLARWHYSKLVLVYLPAKNGWCIGAERDGAPMLWEEWKRGRAGFSGTGPMRLEMRGSDADGLPARSVPSVVEMIARLDPLLQAASALAPDDAPAFARARAALRATNPERFGEGSLLPPIAYVLGVRRLVTAIDTIRGVRRDVDRRRSRSDPCGMRCANSGRAPRGCN